MLAYRFAVIGAGLGAWMFAGGGALALTRDGAGVPAGDGRAFIESKGIVGFGFGLGPWWGPNEYYPPPAYYYPPPVDAVPPPPGPAVSNGCREFQSTVIVDGQPRMSKGLACPQADGTWRIVQ